MYENSDLEQIFFFLNLFGEKINYKISSLSHDFFCTFIFPICFYPVLWIHLISASRIRIRFIRRVRIKIKMRIKDNLKNKLVNKKTNQELYCFIKTKLREKISIFSVFLPNESTNPDLYQNKTDPQQCFSIEFCNVNSK